MLLVRSRFGYRSFTQQSPSYTVSYVPRYRNPYRLTGLRSDLDSPVSGNLVTRPPGGPL